MQSSKLVVGGQVADVCPSCSSDRRTTRKLLTYIQGVESRKAPCGDAWHVSEPPKSKSANAAANRAAAEAAIQAALRRQG
jgi:hypothetical protein